MNLSRSCKSTLIVASILWLPAHHIWQTNPAVLFAAPSKPQPKPPADNVVLKRLDTGDITERRAAARELRLQHTILIKQLCEIIQEADDPLDSDSRDRCAVAAHLLRDMRAADAIPVLVKCIEVRGVMNFGSEPTPFRAYPCGDALVAIGQSSVPAIISHLVSQHPDKVSDLAITLYTHAFLEIYSFHDGGVTEALAVISRARGRKPSSENLLRLETKLKELTKTHE